MDTTTEIKPRNNKYQAREGGESDIEFIRLDP